MGDPLRTDEIAQRVERREWRELRRCAHHRPQCVGADPLAVVAERLALRALRREKSELRRAARAGDAPAYSARAISALQIAAAPHFPAEPRALVCGEVLSLFNEKERTGKTGEIIRTFFTSDEITSFSRQSQNQSPLLNLHPDLEQILRHLESRLQT